MKMEKQFNYGDSKISSEMKRLQEELSSLRSLLQTAQVERDHYRTLYRELKDGVESKKVLLRKYIQPEATQ